MSYKWWVSIAVFLFCVGLLVGLATPADMIGLLAEEINAFEEFGSILVPFSIATVFLIFIRNTTIVLLSFVLSPFLCLVPALVLVVNGWFLGIVSMLILQEESLGFLLSGLLPHGLVELPALFLGEAAAISFGVFIIIALFKKDTRDKLLPRIKKSFTYLIISCALLLPAAIIETYITPLLLT